MKVKAKTEEWFSAKNDLQTFCDRRKIEKPVYEVKEEGPPDKKLFTGTVKVCGQTFSSKTKQRTKKDAQIDVALIAFKKISLEDKLLTDSSSSNKTKEKRGHAKNIDQFFKRYEKEVVEPIVRCISSGKDNNNDKAPGKDKVDRFKNLIVTAFTHSSVLNSESSTKEIGKNIKTKRSNEVIVLLSYESLEFTGDATLSHLVSKHLYECSNGWSTPGTMTKARSIIVNKDNLKEKILRRGLHELIMCCEVKEILSTSIPGDVMEAIIGATCIAFGEEATDKVLKEVFNIY